MRAIESDKSLLQRPNLRSLAPLALLALTIFLNLWILRGERLPAPHLNDTSLHAGLVRWGEDRIDQGETSRDGWFPRLAQGNPLPRQYQTLPHTITANIAHRSGVDADTLVAWITYLLLALWPLSIYWSARLFGFTKWEAVAAAAAAPLIVSSPAYGAEHGSYTWRGYGMWPQLWGMWILPFALAVSWRAVARHGSLAPAAALVALTAAMQFRTLGYLAAFSVGMWALLVPFEFRRRAVRSIVVVLGAILALSWMIVPLFSGTGMVPQSSGALAEGDIQGNFYNDSYGANKVLGWFFHGDLFDGHGWNLNFAGSLPGATPRVGMITTFVMIGFVVAVFRSRRDERCRAILAFFIASLLLFFGRSTLGPLLRLLPGSDSLLLHRFLVGVHIGGIWLAGIGAVWVARRAVAFSRLAVVHWNPRSRRIAPVAVATLAVLLGLAGAYPNFRERQAHDAQGARWIRDQRNYEASDGADLAALFERARSIGPGRIYSGMSFDWGANYKVGFVPVYVEALNHDMDALGFYGRPGGAGSIFEFSLAEANPLHYKLMNVQFLVLPADHPPAVAATFVEQRGRHTLWTVPTSGYLEVIDTVAFSPNDNTESGASMAPFMWSTQLTLGHHPSLAIRGRAAGPITLQDPDAATRPPGTVVRQSAIPDQGAFGGQVELTRPGVVMLRSSYHSGWTAEVDGHEAPTFFIVPGYVGVAVPAGTHSIAFRYKTYDEYWLLYLISALSLATLEIVPRYRRRIKTSSR